MLRMRARAGLGSDVDVGCGATTGVIVSVAGRKGVEVAVYTGFVVDTDSDVGTAGRSRMLGRQEANSRSTRM
jgi:hypothetical protein